MRGIVIFAAKKMSRSSSTKIQHIHKKEIAAQLTSHRLGNQRALRRCGARASIIFPLVLLPLHLRYLASYQLPTHIVIAGCPGPLVPIGETGKEFICRSRARAAAWYFFHNSIPVQILTFFYFRRQNIAIIFCSPFPLTSLLSSLRLFWHFLWHLFSRFPPNLQEAQMAKGKTNNTLAR